MDGRNNFFYDPQYENHSQDYFPNLENLQRSGFDNMNSQFSQNPTQSHTPEFHQTTENLSEDSPPHVVGSNNPQGWTNGEDIALMSAYCFVSNNPIVGTNQNSSSF